MADLFQIWVPRPRGHFTNLAIHLTPQFEEFSQFHSFPSFSALNGSILIENESEHLMGTCDRENRIICDTLLFPMSNIYDSQICSLRTILNPKFRKSRITDFQTIIQRDSSNNHRDLVPKSLEASRIESL